ncbi:MULTISPECIES: hypothetical protein [Vibrio]|uniref:SRPBCC family protein n=1 Tax=Vibrio bivalvicida TaxID=1276888 RepID=A0A177Y1M6_9VIBR|nr:MULTISPECIES: hypothetical protein [Vibrio]KLN63985.1 hypothetical protein ZX61_17800 [Vibrio sp. VPAP30]OAJ94772.1 hypothetical protein APB76_05680 [Vibrio bivalvicida]
MFKKGLTFFTTSAIAAVTLASTHILAASSSHSSHSGHSDNTVSSYGYKGIEETRTSTFEIPLPKEEAFYLFTPIGEKNWVPPFNPAFYGGKEEPKRGRVFSTLLDGQFIVWQITDYDPENNEIAYSRFIPERDVTLLTVDVDQLSGQKSLATVTYYYTSTSEAGDEYVQKMAHNFDDYILEWKKAVDKYLESGR